MTQARKQLSCAAIVVLLTVGSAAWADPATIEKSLEQRREEVNGVLARSDTGPGAKVFDTVCAVCHDGSVEKAPHRNMLQLMSAGSIYHALTEGAMKTIVADLSDTQKRDVAEYLGGGKLGADQAYTPKMCTGDSAVFDVNEPPAFPGWGLERGNARHVPTSVAGIDAANVGRLKLKWAFAFPDSTRVRSQPMPAGGALYMGSNNGTVFALDRATGCVRWMYRATSEVRTGIVISPWKAGDKLAAPLAYFGDFTGNVYAVDARTGVLKWKIRPDDHPNATITGAPTLYGDKLFVPVSALEVASAVNSKYACCTFRGSVAALDATTGARIWQTYTIRETPKPVGKNASGTDIIAPSGAPVWNSPAVDEKRHRLYFGTGENYSEPASLTSDAIIAVDMNTGKVAWVYQATANDVWNSACEAGDHQNCPKHAGPDFDFGAGATYNPGLNGGKDLVVAGQKSGTVYALDPDTGKLLWKVKAGRGGLTGGVHFGLSVGDNRIYVPIADNPDGKSYTETPRPGLYALAPDTGKYLWESPMADTCNGQKFCMPGISQAITSTTDLVIAGALDSIVRIYDAKTGKVLWQYDTTQAVKTVSGETTAGGGMGGGAGPVPYHGMLFVSSGYGFSGIAPGNALLAFEVR